MATSFLGFARLPYELRHGIWERALPSASSKPMEFFIKCLVHLILSQPRDTFFGYGVPTKYDGTTIDDFMRGNPSPYAGLDACPESKVVALKHLKKLLHRQKDSGSWLANPKFPYSDSELILRKREGELIYRCERITDGFDLTSFVFWKFSSDTKPKRTPAVSLANFEEEEEQWKEARDLDPMKNEEVSTELRIVVTRKSIGKTTRYSNQALREKSYCLGTMTMIQKCVRPPAHEDVTTTQDVGNEEMIKVLEPQPKNEALSEYSYIKRKRRREESDGGDDNNQPARKRRRL